MRSALPLNGSIVRQKNVAPPEWLYRGVSRAMHEANKGLQPKATGPFIHEFKWGEPGLKWGVGATWGQSEKNAILRHQLNQQGFPTSGISTTPFRERAEFYAGGVKRADGVVYKIPSAILLHFGIKAFRVSEFVSAPSVPEDDEFILVGAGGDALPSEVVEAVLPVSSA